MDTSNILNYSYVVKGPFSKNQIKVHYESIKNPLNRYEKKSAEHIFNNQSIQAKQKRIKLFAIRATKRDLTEFIKSKREKLTTFSIAGLKLYSRLILIKN